MNLSSWPANFDSFVDPSSSTRMNDPVYGHAQNHNLANDALYNIEHFIGATPNYNIILSGQTAGGALAGTYPNPVLSDPQLYAVPYTKTGTLTATAGALRFPAYKSVKVLGTIATVNTAPTGANIILDVLKNGTSIYTTTNNRPTIVSNTYISQIPYPTPDINTAILGDYFQVNILQVGSITAGSDISVVIITQ